MNRLILLEPSSKEKSSKTQSRKAAFAEDRPCVFHAMTRKFGVVLELASSRSEEVLSGINPQPRVG
jgi:hypothetical protein